MEEARTLSLTEELDLHVRSLPIRPILEHGYYTSFVQKFTCQQHVSAYTSYYPILLNATLSRVPSAGVSAHSPSVRLSYEYGNIRRGPLPVLPSVQCITSNHLSLG